MHLKKSEWEVKITSLATAQDMVRRLHYAKGGSNTATDVHGLFRKGSDVCMGVAWWLPPTKVACLSVHEEWKKVVSLTRLVLEPSVPTNGASYLLGQSVKILRREGRWKALVTYADESQGHTGKIYQDSNWTYVGRTGPYPRWEDSSGKQVAVKATRSRTKAEMEALGHRKVGSFHKHKYVYFL